MIGSAVSVSSCLANSSRRVRCTPLGGAPTRSTNRRRSWRSPDAYASRQRRQRLLGQRAFVDQLERARHRGIAAPPGAVVRRQLRPATQAGPEAGGFGRGGMAEIRDVPRFGVGAGHTGRQ